MRFVVIVHDPDAKDEYRAFRYSSFKRADADAGVWRTLVGWRAKVFVLPVEEPEAFKP